MPFIIYMYTVKNHPCYSEYVFIYNINSIIGKIAEEKIFFSNINLIQNKKKKFDLLELVTKVKQTNSGRSLCET